MRSSGPPAADDESVEWDTTDCPDSLATPDPEACRNEQCMGLEAFCCMQGHPRTTPA
jgi:hypothetical protein